MGVLDGSLGRRGEGAVLGVNLELPIVTNGNFATWLFPNYFGQYLFSIFHSLLMVAAGICYVKVRATFCIEVVLI